MSIYISKKKVNPQLFPSFCGISVKDFITKRGCDSLFANCNATTIDSIISYNDTASVTTMVRMFDSSKIQTIPLLNTNNVTDMSYMFNNCANLQSIPAMDVSNVTSLDHFVGVCRNVTAIHIKNIKVDLDISNCNKMEKEAIVEILNNLGTVTGKTLTLGPILIEKITDADKKIATDKGWTLKFDF